MASFENRKVGGKDDEAIGRKRKRESDINDEEKQGHEPSECVKPPCFINNKRFKKENPPTQLFRMDYISAMRMPDREVLYPYEYCEIKDKWKVGWEKGVQVPVGAETMPEIKVREIRKRKLDGTFELPQKLIKMEQDGFNPEIIPSIDLKASQDVPFSRYDMDDVDMEYLKLVNEDRNKYELFEISEDTFEKVIEKLEELSAIQNQSLLSSPHKYDEEKYEIGLEGRENINDKGLKLQDSEIHFYSHVSVDDVTKLLDLERDIVENIFNYWKLKRSANHDRPLLPESVENKSSDDGNLIVNHKCSDQKTSVIENNFSNEESDAIDKYIIDLQKELKPANHDRPLLPEKIENKPFGDGNVTVNYKCSDQRTRAMENYSSDEESDATDEYIMDLEEELKLANHDRPLLPEKVENKPFGDGNVTVNYKCSDQRTHAIENYSSDEESDATDEYIVDLEEEELKLANHDRLLLPAEHENMPPDDEKFAVNHKGSDQRTHAIENNFSNDESDAIDKYIMELQEELKLVPGLPIVLVEKLDVRCGWMKIGWLKNH